MDHRHRAATRGELPEATGAVVAGIALPPGQLVVPDAEFVTGEATDDPVAWVSSDRLEDLAALRSSLAASFATTGLWPLALESLDGEDDRPWLAGELDPSCSTDPAGHDAAAVLREGGEDLEGGGDDDDEDDGDDGDEEDGDEDEDENDGEDDGEDEDEDDEDGGEDEEAGAASRTTGRLGLVSVTRPADAVAVLGWQGPVNHFADMGRLAAVLRSWEDRFDAYLVGIGFDTITLSVGRPPATAAEALSIAQQHASICPDNVFQGVGSIPEYAQELVGATQWTLWWD